MIYSIKELVYRKRAFVTAAFLIAGVAFFLLGTAPAHALTTGGSGLSGSTTGPATKSHPASSASKANCNSNQKAVKITSGSNKGKYYCVAKQQNNTHGGQQSVQGGGGGNGNNSALPQASISNQCSNTFFGLIPWYNYLGPEFTSSVAGVKDQGGDCTIKCFNIFTLPHGQQNDCGVSHSDIPYVLLAIVDDLLRIAGIVAVAFVLVGAFRYVGSQGDPEGTAAAQSTIINALIGLAISIVSVAFVSYVGSRL